MSEPKCSRCRWWKKLHPNTIPRTLVNAGRCEEIVELFDGGLSNISITTGEAVIKGNEEYESFLITEESFYCARYQEGNQ